MPERIQTCDLVIRKPPLSGGGLFIYLVMKADGAEDLTPYTFRHNLAWILYAAGVDIKEAQSILGHADFSTTANINTPFEESGIERGGEAGAIPAIAGLIPIFYDLIRGAVLPPVCSSSF